MEEYFEENLKEFVRKFLTRNSTGTGVDFDKHPKLRNVLEKYFRENHGNASKNRLGASFNFAFLCAFIAFFTVAAGAYFRLEDHSNCLWKMPDFLRDLLRTPVNCSVCKNLHSVERVENVTDAEAFMVRYVDAGVPVVVSDATDGWSARRIFSFEFFRTLYSNKSRANCQFFKYRSKFENLADVFDSATMAEGEEPWYVGWSNCDGETAEVLRSQYARPYFLPALSESAHTDWIFMGSPAYGAHFHVDDVEYPSWQAQIRGQKKWFLHPPPECHYTCDRRFLEVTLEPGDTLVVDTNWWYHKTLVIGDEISISIGSEFD